MIFAHVEAMLQRPRGQPDQLHHGSEFWFHWSCTPGAQVCHHSSEWPGRGHVQLSDIVKPTRHQPRVGHFYSVSHLVLSGFIDEPCSSRESLLEFWSLRPFS